MNAVEGILPGGWRWRTSRVQLKEDLGQMLGTSFSYAGPLLTQELVITGAITPRRVESGESKN